MKVAIISSGFLPVVDGVTVTLANRLKHLSDYGHQVLLLCPGYSSIEAIYPDWRRYVGDILPGVEVVSLASEPFMDVDFERNASRASYATVLQELGKFQPDLIHVDEPDRLFLGFWQNPGVDFARRNKIPCVAFFHTNFVEYIEDYFSLPGWIIAILQWVSRLSIARNYNAYDLTLTASPVTYQKVVRMGIKNGLNADLLGVDIGKFHPELRNPQFFEQTYGLADVDDKIKLIFLGRLTPDKGWNFTLDAFAKMAQKSNLEQVAVIIAGDGQMHDQIASQLGCLPLSVSLLGRIPPEQVPALMVNSDIHVTASEKETRGLTLLEAFAAGIPAIAPRAGGVIDTIQDGYNGFLFEPKNQADFADKLHQLMDDATLRQTMGRRGREYVAQHSWNQAVNQLVSIWQEQIDRQQMLSQN